MANRAVIAWLGSIAGGVAIAIVVAMIVLAIIAPTSDETKQAPPSPADSPTTSPPPPPSPSPSSSASPAPSPAPTPARTLEPDPDEGVSREDTTPDAPRTWNLQNPPAAEDLVRPSTPTQPDSPNDPTPAPKPTPTPTTAPPPTTLPAGSARDIFDADGNVGMPMPELVRAPEVTRNDDGTATVTFGIGFDVSNTASLAQVRADVGILHVMVHEKLGAGGGPLRTPTPLFSQILIESQLDAPRVERDYAVDLPADVVSFLDEKGFASDDADQVRDALRHVDIDVQHMRDFTFVDGEWDWQQGRAWTGADLEVRTSVDHSSTVTVSNTTDDGVYDTEITSTTVGNLAKMSIDDIDGNVTITEYGKTVYDGRVDGQLVSQIRTSGEEDANIISYNVDGTTRVVSVDTELVEQTDAFAAPISLAGQSVQCIAQGNGSNPQGFSLMNGWDIQYGLAPGTVPAGAQVTQTVVASDSLDPSEAENLAEDTADATVQITASALDLTTPGIKSGVQYAYMLSEGLEAVSSAATLALAVPIEAITELSRYIHEARTDSCADFANVVNITAVEPSGAQSSVSWADQTDGFFSVYHSATNDDSPVNGSVQLSQSTGFIAGERDGVPFATHPYLSQVPRDACGDKDCPTNNVIDLQWSINSPCPQTVPQDCLPTPESVASPQVSVPGTDLCGFENELCPVVAAPIAAASQVPSTTADLAGTEGAAYAVLQEWNPAEAVTAMTLDQAGNAYVGIGNTVFRRTPTGALLEVLTTAGTVRAMGLFGNSVWVSDDEDGLNAIDATTDASSPPSSTFAYAVPAQSPITEMVDTGDGAFSAIDADDNLWLVNDTPPGTLETLRTLVWEGGAWSDVDSGLAGADIVSSATDQQDLYLGFSNGSVVRCALTDCAPTMELMFAIADTSFEAEFATQAMVVVGNALYLGGSDGSLWQLDTDSGRVGFLKGPGDDSAQVAGLALADGVLYGGGCFGIANPIDGDMLGVFTVTDVGAFDASDGGFPAQFGYPAHTGEIYGDSCQNPSSSASHYKGFDPTTYQLQIWQPDDSMPAVIYASFSIDTGNFFYALQNTSAPTTGICSADCPPQTDPASYESATTTSPLPPAGSLADLASPDIVATCDAFAGFGTTATGAIQPVTGAAITAGGIQFSAAQSETQECVTQYTWNLNNVGTLPYTSWSGTATPDVDNVNAAPALTASAGWNTVGITTDAFGPDAPDTSDPIYDLGLTWFAPEYLATSPDADAFPYPLLAEPLTVETTSKPSLAPAPTTGIPEGGTDLAVDITDAGLLVVTIAVPAGAGATVIDIADDTLVANGAG